MFFAKELYWRRKYLLFKETWFFFFSRTVLLSLTLKKTGWTLPTRNAQKKYSIWQWGGEMGEHTWFVVQSCHQRTASKKMSLFYRLFKFWRLCREKYGEKMLLASFRKFSQMDEQITGMLQLLCSSLVRIIKEKTAFSPVAEFSIKICPDLCTALT